MQAFTMYYKMIISAYDEMACNFNALYLKQSLQCSSQKCD